jgi:polysulfide reductase chain C
MELRPQIKWRWLIAFYLFLAGVGGGAYIVGVAAGFAGPDWDLVSRVGIALAWPCVAIGSIFLIFDLGTPMNFWRTFRKPGTSWMARGAIIITIFMTIAFVHLVLGIWPLQVLDAGILAVLGVVGAVFAFLTVVYTGILLAASRPVAFWSTAMLPALFTVSALSTGVMAIILVAGLIGGLTPALALLAKLDILLILLEVVVLVLYLQAGHRVPEYRASVRIVLSGGVAPLFWFGVALLGLAVPLGLELLEVFALTGGAAMAALIISAVSGLVGGLCLRQVVLAGGIQAPLRAGRFEYVLTNP